MKKQAITSKKSTRMRRAPKVLARFLKTESGGGVALLAATAAALAMANTGLADSYEEFWHLNPAPGSDWFGLDLRHWVNEGLMALFFFVVGLEIKRELTRGELKDRKHAALPLAGAIGGMLLPAAIYLVITAKSGSTDGWPIPMATDIAFAIGLVSLLGRMVPLAVKLFILALAIADDIGAVVVIAMIGPEAIVPVWLAATLIVVNIAALTRNRWDDYPLLVAGVGAVLWFTVLRSGIHPTLAAIALALVIPSESEEDPTPDRLEAAIHPWTSLLVLPVFALANAGVRLSGAGDGLFSNPVTLGIIGGLVLGKTLGISAGAWIAVRMKMAMLPGEIRWPQIFGAAGVCGIGFTVSLFMAGLVFDATQLTAAKIGILAGSLLSAVVGSGILLLFRSPGKSG